MSYVRVQKPTALEDCDFRCRLQSEFGSANGRAKITSMNPDATREGAFAVKISGHPSLSQENVLARYPVAK